jgi:ribonuclease P protein component
MRRSEDFAQTIRGGARAGRTSVVVHARVEPGRAGRRVGLVVSKAVGGAVVRNRVRRRLRSVVVDHCRTLPNGADVVVRALPAAAGMTYAQLEADVVPALGAAVRRAGAASGGRR